jgi:mannose-1-phosphate guanylyltransferase
LAAEHGEDAAVLVVMAADHLIHVAQGSRPRLSTRGIGSKGLSGYHGIRPTAPETGFGYIEVGEALDGTVAAAFGVSSKPDPERLRRNTSSGRFCGTRGCSVYRRQPD